MAPLAQPPRGSAGYPIGMSWVAAVWAVWLAVAPSVLAVEIVAPVVLPAGVSVAPLAGAAARPATVAPAVDLRLGASAALGPRLTVSALAAAPAVHARPAASKATVAQAAGGTLSAARRLAAAGRSRPAADAVFDSRAEGLSGDETVTLVVSGYRFDAGRGEVLKPGRPEPLTRAEVRGLRNTISSVQSRFALAALDAAESIGDRGRADRLIAQRMGVLPRELLKAKKHGTERYRAVLARRSASAWRRFAAKGYSREEEPGELGTPEERALGSALSRAAAAVLERNPEGRRLLESLRDDQGELRLPRFLVLGIDARYGAFFTNYGGQMVLSLDYLLGRLLREAPESEHDALRAAFAGPAAAQAYLAAHPEAAERVARTIDTTIFHELVHFRQSLRDPVWQATAAAETIGLSLVEDEYEAYFLSNLYNYEALALEGPDALRRDRFNETMDFIEDFDRWAVGIDDSYAREFTATVGPVEVLQAQHARAVALMDRQKTLAAPGSETVLEAWRRGGRRLEEERKVASVRLAEYRARREAILDAAVEGVWQAGNRALSRLERGEEPLELRLHEINHLSALHSRSGIPWKRGLWIGVLRDYALEAERAEQAGQADRASEFRDARASLLAQLRSGIEQNLALVRSADSSEAREEARQWGGMQAKVLFDVLGEQGPLAEFQALEPEKTR